MQTSCMLVQNQNKMEESYISNVLAFVTTEDDVRKRNGHYFFLTLYICIPDFDKKKVLHL